MCPKAELEKDVFRHVIDYVVTPHILLLASTRSCWPTWGPLVIMHVGWESIPNTLQRWHDCQLTAVKCNSSLGELEFHLTVGPLRVAKHCSIPSYMLQVGKNVRARIPKRFSRRMTKMKPGDSKWLKRVRSRSHLVSIFLCFLHTTYTVCEEYVLWPLWQVTLAKQLPESPHVTDGSNWGHCSASQDNQVSFKVAWGRWTKTLHSFLQRRKMHKSFGSTKNKMNLNTTVPRPDEKGLIATPWSPWELQLQWHES